MHDANCAWLIGCRRFAKTIGGDEIPVLDSGARHGFAFSSRKDKQPSRLIDPRAESDNGIPS